MKTIEIDAEMVYNFRKTACENQYDGCNRALWYNKKTGEFFTTCETNNTYANFEDPYNYVILIYAHGDNNSEGLTAMCEGCTGCTDEFMWDHNIKMEYWELSDYMEELYWADNKANKYSITEEEIDNYHEDDSCSWYCNHMEETCAPDMLSEWYPIDPTNYDTQEPEDIYFEEV